MSERRPEGKKQPPFKWDVLNTFPDHEPTDEELAQLALGKLRRLLGKKEQGTELNFLEKALLSAIEKPPVRAIEVEASRLLEDLPKEISQSNPEEVDTLRQLEDLLGEVSKGNLEASRLLEDLGEKPSEESIKEAESLNRGRHVLIRVSSQATKEMHRRELSTQFHFRKMYEEGQITDNDMESLYDSTTLLLEGARNVGYKWLADENNRQIIFRDTIVPSYIIFQNANYVRRAAELVIDHERKAKPYPEDIMDNPGVEKEFALRIKSAMQKASKIYSINSSFQEVESYFTL